MNSIFKDNSHEKAPEKAWGIGEIFNFRITELLSSVRAIEKAAGAIIASESRSKHLGQKWANNHNMINHMTGVRSDHLQANPLEDQGLIDLADRNNSASEQLAQEKWTTEMGRLGESMSPIETARQSVNSAISSSTPPVFDPNPDNITKAA